jgi:allantoin racemase
MDVVAMMLAADEFDYDAVILAGFGEHGKDALQAMLAVPVLDIAEAAAHDRLALAGLAAHCVSVRACGLGTAEVDADPAGAVQAIVAEAARAVAEDGADVICLGCAGMAGVSAAISAKLGVPAVDGVAAAVALAQALVGLGPSTSKAGVFAEWPDNPRGHWPTSLGLQQ